MIRPNKTIIYGFIKVLLILLLIIAGIKLYLSYRGQIFENKIEYTIRIIAVYFILAAIILIIRYGFHKK